MDDIQNKNSGVVEVAPQITDWIAGQESGIAYVERVQDWTPYLPESEDQFDSIFDTFACVSFSAVHDVESQVNYLIATNQFTPAQMDAIRSLGFIDSAGKFRASPRFVAKMSGTTKNGNWQQKVWDTIHNSGLVPDSDWKFDTTFDWDAYYAEIPQNLQDKAKNILDIININYEWVIIKGWQQDIVATLQYHTKQAPVQILAPVCPMWSRFTLKPDDIVATCPSIVPQHATIVFGVTPSYFQDFDDYNPYSKRLALDYPILYGMKGVVTPKVTPPPMVAPSYVFTQDITFGQSGQDVVMLQTVLKSLGFFNLQPTGFYGQITRASVLKFQIAKNIDSLQILQTLNGMRVGPKTRTVLNSITSQA